MAYSNDDIKELCLEADKTLINGNKYNDKVASLEDLQNRLRRKAKFKEVNFQDECEGGNSLGNLLVKYATENNNSCVKDLFLNNGFKLPQQEQVVVVTNEEEEQKIPDIAENKVETSSEDSSNSRDAQFTISYDKIKKIVANNPGITAEEFGEELKKEKIDIKITNQNGWTLLYSAVRSEGSYITGDRSIFLKVIKLLTNSGIKVNGIQDTAYTLLNRAVITKQADIVKILLESGKFNEGEKSQALNSAIVQGNVQGFKVFLDYIDHAKILEALNKASCNENTDIMKVLLDNKRLTEEEKVNALSNAFVDGDLPKVRLLLKYMTGIPANGIRNLLEIIKESKSPLEEELRTGSEFKVDFDNSDHYEYLSNCVIIALLRSAINNTPGVEENRARSSSSGGNSVSTGQTGTLDGDFVRRLCSSIAWDLSSESLQLKLSKQKISLQSKCEQGTALGNALLEQAIKDEKLGVIKLLLENGVTIINTIEEGRYYISKIKENESILCSVVSDPDDKNAEVLSMLLQNINAEQLKLDPESELYRLYQQLKDDAFCTAFEERNSVAATVLIKSDQERIAPCESVVNKNETPIATGTNHATIPPSLEEDKPKPSGNVDDEPVPPIPTKKTDTGSTAGLSSNNEAGDFTNDQFFPPNEKETKYKKSKENFHTSLRNNVIGVVITASFIAAAVMVPSIAGAAVCGIVAALALVVTGIRVKDSTLPSYKEMREVELTKQNHIPVYNAQI